MLSSSRWIMGSPPQVRGKLPVVFTVFQCAGITPAGAGKTRSSSKPSIRRRDHPRRCGENSYAVTRFSSMLGSPPQVRGKLDRCMGAAAARRDHPRRCGENFAAFPSAARTSGSPPQVRGKPLSASTHHRVYRITPAGAGKTLLLLLKLSACRDHPRRCGENFYASVVLAFASGSPPQVRGKPGGGSGPGDTIGDHPRRCGENCRPRRIRFFGRGSPPQVRGKLRSIPERGAYLRITPAGAGKTRPSHHRRRAREDHPRRCGENRNMPR